MVKRTAEEKDRVESPVQSSNSDEQPLGTVNNNITSADTLDNNEPATKVLRIDDNGFDNSFNLTDKCIQVDSPDFIDHNSSTSNVEPSSIITRCDPILEHASFEQDVDSIQVIDVGNEAEDQFTNANADVDVAVDADDVDVDVDIEEEEEEEDISDDDDDDDDYDYEDEEAIEDDDEEDEEDSDDFDEDFDDEHEDERVVHENQCEVQPEEVISNENLINVQDTIVINENVGSIYSHNIKQNQAIIESDSPPCDILNDRISDLTDLTSSDEASLPSSSSSKDYGQSQTDSRDSDQSLQSVLKSSPGRQRSESKKVMFKGVTVFYFRRSQGFTCVPSVGGSTLGMDKTHIYQTDFTLESHAQEKERTHREIMLRRRRFEKMSRHSSASESDNSTEDISDVSESELEEEQFSFLQPVPIKQRRELLRASGVTKILQSEKIECQNIRRSRELCGCECVGQCYPDRCSCALAGIKCQVDRFAFPCGCTNNGCHNANGRIEFNQDRVKAHLFKTLQKVQTAEIQENVEPNQLSNDTYQPAEETFSYTQSYSNDCPDSSTIFMPMQESSLFLANTSPHLIVQSNNDQNPYNQTNGHFSPQNSSCSEVSDYTSEDLEEDYSLSNGQHHEQLSQFGNDTSVTEIPDVANDQCGTSNTTTLPPFVSINSNCDLTSGLYKPNQSFIPYQDPSNQLSIYDPYVPVIEGSIPSTSNTQVFYNIHNSTYTNYPNEAEKDSYSDMNDSGASFLIECNQDDTCANRPNTANTDDYQQQQYVHLNLSMASSSSSSTEAINNDPSTFTSLPLESNEQFMKNDNEMINVYTINNDVSSSFFSDNDSFNHNSCGEDEEIEEEKAVDNVLIQDVFIDQLNSVPSLENNLEVSSENYDNMTDKSIAQTVYT